MIAASPMSSSRITLAAAADAMRGGRVAAAADAYAGAAAINARDPRVLDGQQRVAEIQRDQQNAVDLATGSQLEAGEQWDQAVAHYRAVLQRHADLRFASRWPGAQRAPRRARPRARRLHRTSRATDGRCRTRGSAARTGTRRSEHQRGTATGHAARGAAHCAGCARAAGEPRAHLRQQHARQCHEGGRARHVPRRASWTLPPGQYTVIGRREGFRDVRFELNLPPGQRVAALSVQCTERI